MSKACLDIRPQGFDGGDVSNADLSYTEKTSDVSECKGEQTNIQTMKSLRQN